jgi:hypothetical protein
MKVYKIYKANGEMHSSFDNKQEAIDFLEYGASMEFSEEGFYMEEHLACRCGNEESTETRFDAYGITTGDWCDECYNGSNYPYRKDKYHDYLYAGERLY